MGELIRLYGVGKWVAAEEEAFIERRLCSLSIS